MKLPALLDQIEAAVDSEDSTANAHIVLAQQVADLADMVGWAGGPIDPEQRFFVRFEALMESLRARYRRASEPSIAAIHEALAELHGAIDAHDRHLAVRCDPDPGGEF